MITSLLSFRSFRALPAYGLWLLLALLPLSGFGQAVTSDKDDYAPGEVATITGSGWTQDRQVHVEFKEEPDYPDYHLYDVAVDASGGWVIKYNIEQRHLGVRFSVSAAGQQSGAVATTIFTDAANTKLTVEPSVATYGEAVTLKATLTQQGMSNPAIGNKLVSFTINGTAASGSATTSAAGVATATLTLPSTVSASASSYTITASFAADASYNASSGTGMLTLNKAASSLATEAATGTAGGTVTLKATLAASGSNLSGRTVAFSLNGTSVGSATTNGGGIATLASASLGAIAAGSYPAGVAASFAGEPNYAASTATAALTVNPACTAPAITTQPGSPSLTYGADATYAVAASGTAPLSYKWQVLTAAGATWADINTSSNSTAATATLTLARPTVATSGYQYRCVVANGCGSATSIAGALTVAAKPLTVSGLAAIAKEYDGTATATLNPAGATLVGVVAGESVTLVSSGATAAFADKNAGASKAVTVAGLALSGATAGSYSLAQPTGLAAAITPATLTYKADAASRAYGAANPALSGTVTGFVAGESQASATTGTLAFATPATATSAVGSYAITGAGLSAANYSFAQAPANASALTIRQAQPVISWAAPADITYGTLLGSEQLNATANATGTFTYSPASGAKLSAGAKQTLSVTFTPTDATNYTTAAKAVVLTVLKATPVITWLAPAGITYGTALSATHLNASAGGVAGAFTYSPAAGTVLNAGASQSLAVSFAPADAANYEAPAAKTVALDVAKANASISVVGYSGTYDGAAHGATGTATGVGGTDLQSLLALGTTYTDAPGGPANWTFAGNTNYNSASGSARVDIALAGNTIAFAKPADQTYAVGKTVALEATATSQLAVAFQVVSGPATLSGNTLTLTGAGTVQVQASQAGSGNYAAATAVAQSFVVAKAPATLALGNLAPTYTGVALAATATTTPASLPGVRLTYAQGATPVASPTSAGAYTVTATLDNPDYAAGPVSGTLSIGKAAATLALGTSTFTYDGTAKPVALMTTPVGLAGASLTYDGSAAAPTAAGTYQVAATLTNDNYQAPAAAGTLTIGKAVAPVALASLSATYDGRAHAATASTPAAGASSFTYAYALAGTPVAQPTAAGSYQVTATLLNANYRGEATGTLVIAKADQTITISAPAPASAAYGSSFTVAAASTSGLAVTYTATGPLVAKGTGTFALTSGTGTGAVTYAQAGDANYNPAPTVTETVAAAKLAAQVAVAGYTGTYDGTAHGATGTATGLQGADLGAQLTLGASFVDAPGGTASWFFAGGDNYQDASGTAAITIGKATATLALGTSTFTYDGTAKPVAVTTTPASLPGVAITYQGAAAAPTAAGTYALAATLTTTNYEAAPISGTLTINKAPAPVALASLSPTYSSRPNAATASTPAAGTSSFTYTYDGSAQAPTNAGQYAVVATLVNDNYAGSATGTLAVAPQELTVTADNQARTYGATNPALTVGYRGFVGGEGPSALPTAPVATTTATATSGVGTYPIAVGAGAATNYRFVYVPGTLRIDQAALTATLAASSKVYDGSTAATATGSVPAAAVLNNDALRVVVTNAAFDTRQVGAGKPVTATVALSGAAAANYTLTATTAATTADITARPLTIELHADNKAYDGNPAATVRAALAAATPLVSGDNVTVSARNGLFDSPGVGTGKPVSASVASSGADAGNYAANTTATTTADITAVLLTPAIAASSKVYDGTPAATLSSQTVAGLVNGETAVGLEVAAATFDSKNQGTGKTVTATGLRLTGAAAANYRLAAAATATAQADITPASLTYVATPASRPYGGANGALTGTVTGFVGAETAATATSGTLGFASPATATSPVGPYPIVGSGLAASNGNYTFGQAPANATALSITPATPTVGVVAAASLGYSGTPKAATAAATGVGGSADLLSPAPTLSYAGANGTSYGPTAAPPTTAGDYTVTAAFAGNHDYSAASSAAVAFRISPAPLTVAAVAASKVYGEANPAFAVTYAGLVNNETAAVLGGTLAFSTPATAGSPVGTYAIMPGGLAAANYALTFAPASLTITARPLLVVAAGVNKVYDGTTAATVALSDNRVSGDVLTPAYAAASFAAKAVGTGKAVSVSGITLSGAAAGNYAANATATTTADITALPTAASFGAASKVYDGTPAATVTSRTVTAALAGDAVALGGGVATFDSKQVGTGKKVTLTGAALTGADAGNYALTTVAPTTAAITARPLLVVATGINKVYDGTPAATVTLSDNRVSGDVLTPAYAAASFADANVGAGKPVAVSGISLSGADAANYAANATANATAAITAAATGVALAASGPVQYSDQVTLMATLTATPAAAQAPLNASGGTVAFTLTSGGTSVALGTAPVSGAGVAAKTVAIGQPAGTYAVTAAFTPASANFAGASGSTALAVTKEDAGVVYAGLEYFGTASSTSSTASVEYIATLTDNADAARGTITNAQAAFKDASGTTETVLYGPVPVKLLSATDPTVGSARTGVQTVTLTNAEFGNGGKTFDLVTEAQGSYYQGGTAEHTLITVAVPGQDYVNGGGSVVIGSQAAGSYAATAGSKMNFGFTMKWNKSGKNIQGQMNLIFRRLEANGWHTYQVKSNAINTLGTGTTAAGNQGDFNTKANLTDVTNPLAPLSLGGALDLTVQALEATVTGAPHQIAVTLRDNGGALLLSNNWVGGRTVLQALSGGKISVRSTSAASTATTTARTQKTTLAAKPLAPEPDLTNLLEISPNPLVAQATLRFHTAEGGKAQVYVYDQVGRLVTTLYNAEVQGGQDYTLALQGADYAAGLYFCRLIANGQVLNVRLTVVK